MTELFPAETVHAGLAVTVAGEGPALLLTHGWPHNRQVWSALIEELATEHTVVTPDLPGVGQSRAAPSRAMTPVRSRRRSTSS